MKENKFISVVAYVLNVENSIQSFLRNIDEFLFNKFENYEIILVNDFSSDETYRKIKEINISLHCDNTVVVNFARRHDLETAMLAGTELAIGDYIFEFDSTIMDYSIETIAKVYEKALDGYDIVGAEPENRQKLSSRLFYTLMNKLSYLELNLATESFRLVSRRALNKVLNLKEKIRYRKALYKYSGFPYSSVAYSSSNYVDSIYWTLGDKFKLAVDILFSFSDFGLNITAFFSIAFFLISIIIGIYTITIYLYLDVIASGWTTIMLFLSFSFSGIFFILTLLGKYLTIILKQIQDRPNYIIESVSRLNKNC